MLIEIPSVIGQEGIKKRYVELSAGDEYIIICYGYGKLVWTFNHSDLPVNAQTSSNPSFLTLKNVNENNTGYYECESTYETGHMTLKSRAFVNVKSEYYSY